MALTLQGSTHDLKCRLTRLWIANGYDGLWLSSAKKWHSESQSGDATDGQLVIVSLTRGYAASLSGFFAELSAAAVINRTPRWYVRYDHAQLAATKKRLRKPIKK